MDGDAMSKGAMRPEDLGDLFVERANAGDVDGLVALYEPGAVLAFPDGRLSVGTEAIRDAYRDLLATGPTISPGEQRPALCSDGLALTSTRLAEGDVTAEVARRQPDGTWLWVLDQPKLMG